MLLFNFHFSLLTSHL